MLMVHWSVKRKCQIRKSNGDLSVDVKMKIQGCDWRRLMMEGLEIESHPILGSIDLCFKV